MKPIQRIEFSYPAVALQCHDLIERAHGYLIDGGVKVATQSRMMMRPHQKVRALADYYSKLHSVTGLPKIFLAITAAVWSATEDVPQGLWAIDVIESALHVAMDQVALAAVTIAADQAIEIDAAALAPSINDGVQIVAASVFETALALIEQ